MSNRVKVSDLEVTERTPTLVYISQRASSQALEDPLPILHICKRIGKTGGGKYRSPDCYSVTDCNRPLRYDHTFSDKDLSPTEFRLCSRCGTQADFEQVLADYHKAHKEWLKRDAQRTQEKKAQRQLERKALAERLDEFATKWWVSTDSNPRPVGNPMYALRVEYKGHTYEIKEVKIAQISEKE